MVARFRRYYNATCIVTSTSNMVVLCYGCLLISSSHCGASCDYIVNRDNFLSYLTSLFFTLTSCILPLLVFPYGTLQFLTSSYHPFLTFNPYFPFRRLILADLFS